MITLYGIPNCDTVKKARAWLDARAIPFRFHDYKKAGIEEERLRGWVEALGWEALLNRSGTTFRKLAESERERLDADKAVRLMLAWPSTIRRPVVEADGRLLVGFRPEAWAEALGG